MALRKLTDAAIEPITLEDAAWHLKLDLAATDPDYATTLAEVQALLTAARSDCENRLRRTLVLSTWQLTLDAFPTAVRLPMPRILDVSAVQYLDEAGAQQTLDPLSYEVDAQSEPGWIVPAYGRAWPATRAQINALRITYTAGYGGSTDAEKRAAVPAPIVQWIKLALGDLWEQRKRSADKAAGIAGFATVPAEFAERLLDAYVVYGT